QLNGAVDGVDDRAVRPQTIRVQHAQIDDFGAWRDTAKGSEVPRTRRGGSIPGHDTGHVRAMAVLVVGARYSRNKALTVDDPRSGRITNVRLVLEILAIRDSTVDDRNSNTGSIPAVLAGDIGPNRGTRIV